MADNIRSSTAGKGAIFAVACLLLAASASGRGSWSGHGPSGGLIASMVSVPPDFQTVYAGTSAGLYKSVDGGATWRGPLPGIPTTWIGGLTIDPTDKSVVYAATGGPIGGGGVYRSRDGGTTWSSLPFPDTSVPPSAVAVDPANGARLFVGADVVEVSNDYGNTWVEPATPGVDPTTISFSPSTGSVYACASSLIRSDDHGVTWTNLNTDCYTVVALATSPETLVVGADTGSGIRRSTDGGQSWKVSDTGLPLRPLGFCDACVVPIFALIADPNNSSHLYAGLDGDGAFESNDAGITWTPIPVPPNTYAFTFAFAPTSILIGTADSGVLSVGSTNFRRSNTGLFASDVTGVAISGTTGSGLIAASSGGIFTSSDQGLSWSMSSTPSAGMPIRGVWSHPAVANLAFASTVGGELLRSVNGGQSWTSIIPAGQYYAIFTVVADPMNPKRLLAGVTGIHNPTAILESNDYGLTWVGRALANSSNGIYWIGFDSTNTWTSTFAESGDGFLRSVDRGATWETINASSWDGACFADFGYAPPIIHPWGEPALYLSGVAGRTICRSDDDGKTFRVLSYDPYSDVFAALVADPFRPGVFYGSQTYADPLMPFPIENTINMSSDRGLTWSLIPAGYPGTEGRALVVNLDGSRLFAGTYGSGVVSLPLPVATKVTPATPPAAVVVGKRH